MAKLTNCEVSYERNVKLADYENKKFAARFSVLIEDGDSPEEVTELYGRQIVRFVEDKLGIKSEITVPAIPKRPAPQAALPPAQPAAASSVAPQVAPAPSAAGEAPTTPVKKPGRPKKAEAPKQEAVSAPVEDFPEETKAAPASAIITDAQLREAIQNHVAKHQNPVEVRKLLQTFFPAQEGKVWTSTELPQDKREPFLTKMKALAAAVDI